MLHFRAAMACSAGSCATALLNPLANLTGGTTCQTLHPELEMLWHVYSPVQLYWDNLVGSKTVAWPPYFTAAHQKEH